MLRKGAEELGLDPCYRDFLKNYPSQPSLPPLVRAVAACNFMMILLTAFVWKKRVFANIQRWFIFRVEHYLYPLSPLLSHTLTGLILLPGSLFGMVALFVMQVTGTTPPVIQRIISMMNGGGGGGGGDAAKSKENAPTTTSDTATAATTKKGKKKNAKTK
uniref:Uncharacterized protein n=1 Tax=Cyclophora tenuis TaxID=216820 RepID=A0A7S1DD76_CYCTE|mmetsp:Transcript_9959/g.16678  ORF Transcript_9959/g.16678 Transcript_9959/m.16678 type:complete len:160 (+) Transcript_9959:2-481(+)